MHRHKAENWLFFLYKVDFFDIITSQRAATIETHEDIIEYDALL